MQRLLFVLLIISLFGCESAEQSENTTGFIEGNFAYINAPEAGWIIQSQLELGQTIQVGQELLTLDNEQQKLQIGQIKSLIAQANAKVADMQMGARPVDISVIEKQIAAEKVVLDQAIKESHRLAVLFSQKLVNQAQFEQAQNNVDLINARIDFYNAQLEQAMTSSRDNQIKQAEAEVEKLHYQLAEAEWRLAQRLIVAKIAGDVEQIYARPGEFVKQGTALASVLINSNKKVKFYISESRLHEMKMQMPISISFADSKIEAAGVVSYIANTAEFTPPVIYAKGVRDKLVYLIEAQLKADITLPIGQPVDVSW